MIPGIVIGVVSSVLAAEYFNHTKLNSLFMMAGAPGESPAGNCEHKCAEWLQRCNADPAIPALVVLGHVVQEFMDRSLPAPVAPLFVGSQISTPLSGQARITAALAGSQLTYRTGGQITSAGSSPIARTLEDYFESNDYSSIENEFKRAAKHIDLDPHAAITAACSIIEAALKFYIETFNLGVPPRMTVGPLWQIVQPHLALNSDPALAGDQHKVLKGLTSIIDGVGSFRSHIGSAHGRGSAPPKIVVAEARLSVNASHTIVIFVMDALHTKQP